MSYLTPMVSYIIKPELYWRCRDWDSRSADSADNAQEGLKFPKATRRQRINQDAQKAKNNPRMLNNSEKCAQMYK